jgi:hypothetical protein
MIVIIGQRGGAGLYTLFAPYFLGLVLAQVVDYTAMRMSDRMP